MDGDALTYHVTDAPAHGTLSGTAPNLTYTPDPNYNGSDIFGFRANDGTADSETAWVSIEIAPVNDPPMANAMSVTATEDSSRSITLTGTDIDGDPLTFSIAIQPTDGTLTGTAPNVTYTPFQQLLWTRLVHLCRPRSRWTHGHGPSQDHRQTMSTTIRRPQTIEPPIKEDSGATDQSHPQRHLSPGSIRDIDHRQHNPRRTRQVTIRGGGSHVAYTPDDNYYGQDTFRYTIVDGNGGSATATVSVTVTNENDPPLARPDDAEMDEDGGSIEIDVLDNDTYLPDPEEDLTIVSISDAANGTVTITGGANRA